MDYELHSDSDVNSDDDDYDNNLDYTYQCARKTDTVQSSESEDIISGIYNSEMRKADKVTLEEWSECEDEFSLSEPESFDINRH